MAPAMTESALQQVTLAWFEAMQYEVRFGAAIAPGEPTPELGIWAHP